MCDGGGRCWNSVDIFPAPPSSSPHPPPKLARLPQLRSLDLQQGLAGGVPELYVPALRQLAPLTALTRLRLRVVYGGSSGGLRVRRYWGEEFRWVTV